MPCPNKRLQPARRMMAVRQPCQAPVEKNIVSRAGSTSETDEWLDDTAAIDDRVLYKKSHLNKGKKCMI